MNLNGELKWIIHDSSWLWFMFVRAQYTSSLVVFVKP